MEAINTGQSAFDATFTKVGGTIRRDDGLASDDPILGKKRQPNLWPKESDFSEAVEVEPTPGYWVPATPQNLEYAKKLGWKTRKVKVATK